MKAATQASTKNANLISIRSLHCLSFSAAMCRAYQPAMNAAKPMASSRSALVMLAYNTTASPRSVTTSVLWNSAEPADHPKKFAGLFCVLLVGQFTAGVFGIECLVAGVQGVNRVANHHAVHQRVACGRCESPVQFGCYVACFHLPAAKSVRLRPIKALPPARC